ncbi:hypothetical protein BST86_08695 [Nonlabens agnitus]|uniref:histidine kinase n=1 Tax=Nonlabens agnitus TaxID=870484 RepID=A0A2S9WUL8_9FLAO|nr:hypothetical protein BST86_08695 [Nonlabens agnitus]
MICLCLPFGIKAQGESQSEYSPEELKKEQQLREILGEIRQKYGSQDFVNTISLSQKGRALSDTPRFYNYYVGISSNLGNALFQIGDTLQAIEVFEESLEKAESFQDTKFPIARRYKTLITANIDLANISALVGRFEEAIAKYKAALQLTDDTDIHGLFITNFNIAESYIQLDKISQAAPFVYESEKLSKTIGIDAYAASSKLLLGKFFVKSGEYTRASQELQQSVDFAMASSNKEVLVDAYRNWAASEANLQNWKKAYELSEALDILEKEKFESESVEALQNARAKFNVDEVERRMQAEMEAEQLKAENIRAKALQENTVLWSSIALFIAIILIIALFIGFNRRKKLNKELVVKNTIYLKEKEKSDQLLVARNALFSRISHELRTPMYGIVGISNMLIDDKDIKGENKKNVQSLKYSADYLLSLINNVLEMNKLNRSSNLTLAQENFDIRELSHHAVESAKFIMPHHTNTFKIKITQDVKQVYNGDAVKLMQVLINVLGNSNKFTKNGVVTLNISKVRSEEHFDLLEFSIKDTGKGIEKRKLKDLFDENKFINHNEENEGTGLGLPISNKILELQDSQLSVQSERGNGTEVKFELRLQRVDVIKEKKTEKNISRSKTLNGLKVLIVEDNKINQLVTKKIIKGLNGDYDLADSGAMAIEKARENEYDLILMDINMPPGMDGFEATIKIREFRPEVPIIALTAVEQIEIEERMKNSSMNDYLIKPFKSEDFLSKIFKNIK